jgi:hypothetical protein
MVMLPLRIEAFSSLRQDLLMMPFPLGLHHQTGEMWKARAALGEKAIVLRSP